MLPLHSQPLKSTEIVRALDVNKRRIGITLLAIWLLSIFRIAPAQAQGQGGWSEPYRLSSNEGVASEGYLVADQYGYVHCFWTETLPENQGVIIKYARFDGTTWTKPNDIAVRPEEIKNISPVVDQQGTLHIVWSEGLFQNRAYYSYASANNTLSAQNWAKPLLINVPARPVYLRVDSKGVFHILYINQTAESGVYYIRSEDRGITWSEPVWLDPDIPTGYIPDSLNFELDGNDGLHAAWWYGALDRTLRPDWVRYVHSLDGGKTWSAPVMIDQVIEENEHFLNSASPKMIVQGKNVHVIWAAGDLPYRYYSFSTDSGRTWSNPVQIFGELQGQAFDGMAVDRAGRVHFFGQVRYPIGIYHAYLDETQWTKPSLVYLISAGDTEEGIGNRVHAHFTLPVIRAGNQLVLTFTDGPADPNRRLFTMHSTMDDLLPLESMPTPVPTATSIPMFSPILTPGEPTFVPTQAAMRPSLESAEGQPLEHVPAPDLPIRLALVPTLLILMGTMIIRWFRGRR
jgi:hypothetical protein